MEIVIVFIDGHMLNVWILTLLWKLADSAFSEMLDSDKPTCSKTFILSCIMGLTNTSKPYQNSWKKAIMRPVSGIAYRRKTTQINNTLQKQTKLNFKVNLKKALHL